jgi:hypothetical protein
MQEVADWLEKLGMSEAMRSKWPAKSALTPP